MPSKPPVFRPISMGTRQQAQRDYDSRRGTAHQRGYTKRLRNAMDSFKAEGRITATAVTDHVIPAKGDRVLLEDRDNWQPACRWHHDVVKQKLEVLFAAGRIGAADLRLDSPRALSLAAREGPIGVDGWPRGPVESLEG